MLHWSPPDPSATGKSPSGAYWQVAKRDQGTGEMDQ